MQQKEFVVDKQYLPHSFDYGRRVRPSYVSLRNSLFCCLKSMTLVLFNYRLISEQYIGTCVCLTC